MTASNVDMAHSGPGGPSAATPSGGGGADGGEDTMRLYSVFQNSFNKIASGGGPGKSQPVRNISCGIMTLGARKD